MTSKISKCEFCDDEKNDLDLLTLPCGFNVCLEHFENYADRFDCFMCHEHKVNKQKCFKMAKNRSKLNEMNYFKQVEKVKQKLEEVKQFQDDEEYFLENIASEIINQIDLRRESIKLEICKELDSYADNLVKSVVDFKLKNEKLIQSVYTNTDDFENFFDVSFDGTDTKEKIEFFKVKLMDLKNNERLILDPVIDLIENIKKVHFKEGSNIDALKIKSIFGRVDFGNCIITNSDNESETATDSDTDSDLYTQSTYFE